MIRLLNLAVAGLAVTHGTLRALRSVLLAALVLGCGPGRELVMRAAPGVPPPVGCSPAGASRCEGRVPVVCSASGRWWPATPAGASCPYGCAVQGGPDGGAFCAAEDGGAR